MTLFINLVNNSFNRLEGEGRIGQSSVYIFKRTDGNHEEVSQDEYDNALAFKKDLVESLGVNYKHYILSYRSLHKNKDMRRIIREVDEQMTKEFKISYMYEMIKISIENDEIKREISREKFDQAYFQKFIKLSKDRQNREDYKETESFWRRTYLVNLEALILEKMV
ncbi:hypothetical protein [Amphibacillus cookii]|uniref:hypothetical protein n=1 Tax=Amphibacillus cookii TaxID=767787 RepID=UPI00195E8234|nr:hypothetical protein [Amphibacillus cookii]MBM7541827.1 hypothetical protein [Amphibacillus cookii]